MKKNNLFYTPVPTRWVGPITVKGLPSDSKKVNNSHPEQVELPLATYETPMWPSVLRGARVFTESGGLQVKLVEEKMTRSIVLRANSVNSALAALRKIQSLFEELQQVVKKVSQFTNLQHIHPQLVGNLLYLRFEYSTGDASGHNMVTLASEHIQNFLLQKLGNLRYGSISGNICVDKKTSAINGILGRGKYVIADCLISEKILQRYLRTTAKQMADINIQKNLIGSTVAGSIRSANAHFANMLLAFYLACGQDGANVVEGSQGITHVEERSKDLYFSVSIPNIIVGTVGNGKEEAAAAMAIQRMRCERSTNVGGSSQRLAMLAATAVACGELSLLAAQTNPGELVKAHLKLERNN